MVNIFLIGEDCSGVGLKICKALSHYGGVIHITGKTFTFHSSGKPCFSVSHWKTPPKIYSPRCIVFFNSPENVPESFGQKGNYTVIAPDAPVCSHCITYGFSSQCSIAFSSTETERPCVSIQHPFTCIDGTTAEPCEIPVTAAPDLSESPYEFLGVCAVIAACGLYSDGEIRL